MHKHDGQHEVEKGHHGHEHDHHHGHHEHHHHHHNNHEEKSSAGGREEAAKGAPLAGEITDRVKLVKIMDHWIHHNEEHARSYEEWARRAETLGEAEVASLLVDMARDTRRHGEGLQAALKKLS